MALTKNEQPAAVSLAGNNIWADYSTDKHAEDFINTEGITSGQILTLVAKHFGADDLGMYAEAMGLNLSGATSSTYVLGEKDREVLLLYLNQIKVFIITYGVV